MFLKLRFCKSGVFFFFFWNSRYELLRSWFLSVFLNFRFTCALVCRCTKFVGYFVCIMDAKCFSYLLLAGVLFFRIFLVCRSYGHLSTRSHDYFVVKCTCAIVHLDAWPHRKPMLHPSFSALQSTVSGHGDYSRLPTINFPRCLVLERIFVMQTICFFRAEFYWQNGYFVYGQSTSYFLGCWN